MKAAATGHSNWSIAALGLVLITSQAADAQSAALSAPGRAQSAAGAMSIGTTATGTVEEVLVHEGSRVRAGDALVRLNCEPLEAEAQSSPAN